MANEEQGIMDMSRTAPFPILLNYFSGMGLRSPFFSKTYPSSLTLKGSPSKITSSLFTIKETFRKPTRPPLP